MTRTNLTHLIDLTHIALCDAIAAGNETYAEVCALRLALFARWLRERC
jgi:hypothetical protein